MLHNLLKQTARKIRGRLDRECRHQLSFSQDGEDVVLWSYFGEKAEGFYVDIGAFHPTKYSNTYLFYKKGWSGINVDARPDSMNEFRRLRPRDCNIESAVSRAPGALQYFLFNEPALNTCDHALARQRDGLAHYRLVDTKTVQSQTLASILEKNIGDRRDIDFLSIDVEGVDLEVLESNDWTRYRPSMILAEDGDVQSLSEAVKSPITRFLEKLKYTPVAKTYRTLFFKSDK
jgi:FkbM family methyltransferase